MSRRFVLSFLLWILNAFGGAMLVWIPQHLYYWQIIGKFGEILKNPIWPFCFVIFLLFLPIFYKYLKLSDAKGSQQFSFLTSWTSFNVFLIPLAMFTLWPILILIGTLFTGNYLAISDFGQVIATYTFPAYIIIIAYQVIAVHMFPAYVIIIAYRHWQSYFTLESSENNDFNAYYEISGKLSIGIPLILGLPHRIYALRPSAHVRETQTLMIARNLARDGFDVLHPRLNWIFMPDGDYVGWVAGEFPFLPLLMAPFYYLGVPELGMIIPLFLSIYSIFLFNEVLKLWIRDVNIRTILLVCFSLLPYSVVFSTAVMPDWLNLCAILAVITRTYKMKTNPSKINNIIFFLALTVVGLSKISGLYILPVAMGVLFVGRRKDNGSVVSRKNFIVFFKFLILLFGSLILTGLWYFVWNPAIVDMGGFDLVGGVRLYNRTYTTQYLTDPHHLYAFTFNLVFIVSTPILIFFLGLSLVVTFYRILYRKAKKDYAIWLGLIWLFSIAGYTIVFFAAHFVNLYYLIGFIASCLFFIGVSFRKMFEKQKLTIYAIAILTITILTAILIPSNFSNTYQENMLDADRVVVGLYLNANTDPNDRIAVHDEWGNSAILYWADRIGWVAWLWMYNSSNLLLLLDNGMNYLVWNKIYKMSNDVQLIVNTYLKPVKGFYSENFYLFTIK